MNRYFHFYNNNIRLILLTKYNYTNLYDINKISRVDLSLLVKDNKNLISSLSSLLILSNRGPLSFKALSSGNKYPGDQQKGIILRTSNFGCMSFIFIENLVNYYLPRIRYFKGFPLTSLSKSGNFSFYFKDLMIFPQLEEELELFYKLKNLRLDFMLEGNLKKNPIFFYSVLGINFYK
jgi:ribosomal protein L5